MKKTRIYLDTSLISHLKADETPERTKDTLVFWQDLKKGAYETIVSNITLWELSKCPEPKQSVLLEYLSQIEFTRLSETPESLELSEKYLLYGVLKQKSRDDLRHIALAVVAECDYIISWNFKHFVNIRIINKVNAVNKLLGYRDIIIIPPTMIAWEDENNDQ